MTEIEQALAAIDNAGHEMIPEYRIAVALEKLVYLKTREAEREQRLDEEYEAAKEALREQQA